VRKREIVKERGRLRKSERRLERIGVIERERERKKKREKKRE
jgi:hypothetical protein